MHKNSKVRMKPGVLAKQQMEKLLNDGAVETQTRGSIDYSSLDLTLESMHADLKRRFGLLPGKLDKISRDSEPLQLMKDENGSYFHFSSKQIYLVIKTQ